MATNQPGHEFKTHFEIATGVVYQEPVGIVEHTKLEVLSGYLCRAHVAIVTRIYRRECTRSSLKVRVKSHMQQVE